MTDELMAEIDSKTDEDKVAIQDRVESMTCSEMVEAIMDHTGDALLRNAALTFLTSCVVEGRFNDRSDHDKWKKIIETGHWRDDIFPENVLEMHLLSLLMHHDLLDFTSTQ